MDEQHLPYIRAAQQWPPGTPQRQSALENLAEMMLRSRSVFRSYRGQPLGGIYRQGLQAFREQLMAALDREIDSYCDQPQWMAELRSQALRTVLTADYLQQLALAAQQHPFPTPQGQYARQELTNALFSSGKLRGRGEFSPEVYQEAINETWLWLYKNLQAYDAARGSFISWINYRLSQILLETRKKQDDSLTQQLKGRVVRIKYQLQQIIRENFVESLNFWLGSTIITSSSPNPAFIQILLLFVVLSILSQLYQTSPNQVEALLFEIAQQTLDLSPTLSPLEGEDSSLETLSQSQPSPSLSEQVRQYLEEDPNDLCQVHCWSNSQVTFQAIALKRLDGESWQQISEYFGIKIPALSNFFQRTLKKLSPEIRRYIQGALD